MRDSLLGRFCLLKLDEIIAIISSMPDEVANAVPDLPGANSPYQILTHCLGMLEEWTHADILGLPVHRERATEFTSAGEVRALLDRAADVRAQFASDLAKIIPGQPVPGRRGRDEFWGNDAEGILLHVFEELCQHLGHLEITRDLLTRPR